MRGWSGHGLAPAGDPELMSDRSPPTNLPTEVLGPRARGQRMGGSPAPAPQVTPGAAYGIDNVRGHPERIGPYHLLEVLGSGGMGTVYLAEQGDPLPRQVALKLIRWGGAHEEALRRFELERETMARLAHPSIAQVFDAGTTEHGQPYFVLEYIPGLPITKYCDARRLDLRQRLALLVAVCEGVRHAHEKGVIHRDLKPSNILVTEVDGRPIPKIIDFGIAKALEPWSEAAAAATATRLRVGSPGYMSPEAIESGGSAVDTRSDVYALGVVLFELLVGAHPLETSKSASSPATGHEAPEPPRPSQRLRQLPRAKQQKIAHRRRTGEERLFRRLRGELDCIVGRATHSDPAGRYGTAAELAADIERWLTGRPVEARPPSLVYRARKAVRRHMVAFGACLVILATIVSFGIRSRILYARAESARVQAEELVGFMLDDLSGQLEPRGRLDMLESIARESLAYFESSVGHNLARAGRRPAVALRQIGQVLAKRGDLEPAFEAYEKAREIDQSRLDPNQGDPTASLDLAEDLELLSEVYEAQGAGQQAAAQIEAAGVLLRRSAEGFPEHRLAHLRLAWFLVQYQANLHRTQNRTDAAQSALTEALDMLGKLDRAHPGDPEIRHGIGEAHYQAGLLAMFSRGDTKAALHSFERAAEVFRALAHDQPGSATWRYRLAVSLGQGIAASDYDLERLTEAQRANQEALALYEGLTREEPRNNRWAHGLGWELIRQGSIAWGLGDPETADRAYRRSAEVQAALLARTTGSHTVWLDGLAIAYAARAEILTELGRSAEAIEAATAAIAARREIRDHDEGNLDNRVYLASLGEQVASLRFERGDLSGARDALDAAGRAIAQVADAEVEAPDVREELQATRSGIAALSERLDHPQ